MTDNDSEAPKIVKEPKLFKILCCPIDTKKGQALVSKLHYPYANNTDDCNIIIGKVLVSHPRFQNTDTEHQIQPSSRCQKNNRCKEYIHRCALSKKIKNQETFTKSLIECEVVILDLFEVEYKEVEYAIKTLKYLDQSYQKTLILVSSIKTWALSGRKVKNPEVEEEEEVLDDGEPDEGGDSAAEEEEAQEEDQVQKEPEGDEEEVVKIEYTSFKESDYEKRKTYPCYRNIKTLESLCISAGKSNPNLKTFILCPGVLYGNGEETFFPYFKQAWL